MAPPDPKQLRLHALGLPGAWEDFPWGDCVAKVGTKIFAFLGESTLGVKLPQSHLFALEAGFAERMRYGLGRSGWVTVQLDSPSLGEDLLRDWIVESYRSIAPKRLVRELEARNA